MKYKFAGVLWNEDGTLYSGDVDAVEKKIKALEIIKENIKDFIDFEDSTNRIYIDCFIDCKTQEEYDLLKEILK